MSELKIDRVLDRDADRDARVVVHRSAAYWDVSLDGQCWAAFSSHVEADLYASGIRVGLYVGERGVDVG